MLVLKIVLRITHHESGRTVEPLESVWLEAKHIYGGERGIRTLVGD